MSFGSQRNIVTQTVIILTRARFGCYDRLIDEYVLYGTFRVNELNVVLLNRAFISFQQFSTVLAIKNRFFMEFYETKLKGV